MVSEAHGGSVCDDLELATDQAVISHRIVGLSGPKVPYGVESLATTQRSRDHPSSHRDPHEPRDGARGGKRRLLSDVGRTHEDVQKKE